MSDDRGSMSNAMHLCMHRYQGARFAFDQGYVDDYLGTPVGESS